MEVIVTKALTAIKAESSRRDTELRDSIDAVFSESLRRGRLTSARRTRHRAHAGAHRASRPPHARLPTRPRRAQRLSRSFAPSAARE
jgi:hypothetical protein